MAETEDKSWNPKASGSKGERTGALALEGKKGIPANKNVLKTMVPSNAVAEAKKADVVDPRDSASREVASDKGSKVCPKDESHTDTHGATKENPQQGKNASAFQIEESSAESISQADKTNLLASKSSISYNLKPTVATTGQNNDADTNADARTECKPTSSEEATSKTDGIDKDSAVDEGTKVNYMTKKRLVDCVALAAGKSSIDSRAVDDATVAKPTIVAVTQGPAQAENRAKDAGKNPTAAVEETKKTASEPKSPPGVLSSEAPQVQQMGIASSALDTRETPRSSSKAPVTEKEKKTIQGLTQPPTTQTRSSESSDPGMQLTIKPLVSCQGDESVAILKTSQGVAPASNAAKRDSNLPNLEEQAIGGKTGFGLQTQEKAGVVHVSKVKDVAVPELPRAVGAASVGVNGGVASSTSVPSSQHAENKASEGNVAVKPLASKPSIKTGPQPSQSSGLQASISLKPEQPKAIPATSKVSSLPSNASGVVNSTTDARWMRMYERLKTFKEKTGTFEVDENEDKTIQALRPWVALQRKQYHDNELYADRQKLLGDLGFPWTAPSRAAKKARRGSSMTQAPQVRTNFMGICVCIEGSDKVWFNLLPNTTMSKVIENIAFPKYGILREDAQFFVSGGKRKSPIQPKDTPASLGLQDGDQIDLVVTSTAAKSLYKKPAAARNKQAPPVSKRKDNANQKSVTLSISVVHAGNEETRTIFKVNPSTRMGAIFDNLPYTKYGVAGKHDVQFYVSGGPGPLLASQSVESLGLQHGDQIDLVVKAGVPNRKTASSQPTYASKATSSTSTKRQPPPANDGGNRNLRARKEDSTADVDARSWMVMYRKLKKHGNGDLKESRDHNLYHWVSEQRLKLHSDDLKPEQRELLVGLGYKWEEKPRLIRGIGDSKRITSNSGNKETPAIDNAVNSLVASKKVAPRHHKMWMDRYEELRAYKEAFGTTLLPRSNDEYSSLQQWTSRQRRLHWEGTLGEDRMELLNQLGFVWEATTNPPEAHDDKKRAGDVVGEANHTTSSNQPKTLAPIYQQMWKKKYNDLKDYHKKYGTATIPNSHREYKNLYRWCWRQRGFYAQKTLLPERKKLLEDLGFEWEIKEQEEERGAGHQRPEKKSAWEEKEEADSVNDDAPPPDVPQDEYDQQLPLIPYSEEYQKRWMRQYKSLKAFQRKFGHQQVGSRTHKGLYFWMVRQRQALKANKMSGDRKELLDDIGFDWEFKWEKKREDDEDGIEDVDDQEEGEEYEDIDDEEEEDKRKTKKRAKEEEEEDSSSGKKPTSNASTDPKAMQYDVKWMTNFKDLKAYKKKHGSMEIRYSDFPNRSLYYWVWRLRKLYKTGELPEHRQELLESIGFEWNKGAGEVTKDDKGKERKPAAKSTSKDVDSDISSSDEEEQENDDENLSEDGDTAAARPVYQDQWMSNYQKLCAFKKKFKTTEVTYSDEAYRSLYYWVWRQKKYNRERSLQEDRRQLLKKIGFDFGTGHKSATNNADENNDMDEDNEADKRKSSAKKDKKTKDKKDKKEKKFKDKSKSNKRKSIDSFAEAHPLPEEEAFEEDATIPLEVGKLEDMENYLDSVEVQIHEKERELQSLKETRARLRFMVKRARPNLPESNAETSRASSAKTPESDWKPSASKRRRT